MYLSQSPLRSVSVLFVIISTCFILVHFHCYFNGNILHIHPKNYQNLIPHNGTVHREFVFLGWQNNNIDYNIEDFEKLWMQLQPQIGKNVKQDENESQKLKIYIQLPSMNQKQDEKASLRQTESLIQKIEQQNHLHQLKNQNKKNTKISLQKFQKNLDYSPLLENELKQPLPYLSRKLTQISDDELHQKQSSNKSTATEKISQQKNDVKQDVSSNSSNAYDNAYIALCLIAKQEHKFVKEWVTYHHYIGVHKFYIYDHGSSPPMKPLIQNFIDSGLVSYQYITTEWQNDSYHLNDKAVWFNGVKQINSPQRWVHSDCFEKNRKKHQFMAMIDVDEFIVLNQGANVGKGQGQGQPRPQHTRQTLKQGQGQGQQQPQRQDQIQLKGLPQRLGQGQGQGNTANQGQMQTFLPVENPNLPNFLKEFENFGGLIVYWRIYGSSGLLKSPEKGVLASYQNCQSKQLSGTSWTDFKHIVNTKYMGSVFCVIHGCLTTQPSVTSDHKEKKIWQNKINPVWDRININHYMIKSWEDFEAKRARGGGHSPLQLYASWRNRNFFKGTDAFAPGNCSFMQEVANKCCQ